jgi:hypothetical protein
MVRFQPLDLPIAYSMVTAAKRLKKQNNSQHPYQKFFYYWAAFNNIYTTIAYSGNRSTMLKKRPDGTIERQMNGNVQIPKVKRVNEQEQIAMAFAEFDDELKHYLIVHESTEFFAKRTPSWQGRKITKDAIGQRLNGVLNVNYTVDKDYPVWSPIDLQTYSQYIANPKDSGARTFLAKQIVNLLYTVRCNLMHGDKRFDDRNDLTVVENALPLLAMIVSAFTR